MIFIVILSILAGSTIISRRMEMRGYDFIQIFIACAIYAAAVLGLATLAGLIQP